MVQQPKRKPGDPNPTPRPVTNTDWHAGGRGHDYGIARALGAFLDWRKRRKDVKARGRDSER
ncbi:hypothetical protein KUV85_11250 [Nocardioides panacisoli]|uniref:hypothetical protein n=1 Tax=Nocardioides panacisoli TaxID=627624 RepID=UPI001C636B1B|nr:hypothetical protein [Nocardioides panacisoli]QYJ02911.1 hypothetical protein KUV85_11250 [Nocardioides panacisoli]